MLILEVNKSLQKLIGLDSQNQNNPRVVLWRVVAFTLPLLSTISTALANFAFNLPELNKATESMHPICAFIIILTMHWHLLINRNKYVMLMDDLNEIVNER